MKRILTRSWAVLAFLLVSALTSTAVTFSVSPTTTSNTYTGFITLQVGGLSLNETVVVSKYLDLNSNGIAEPSDFFVQQCQIQDGQGPTLIGGATNVNIPYDHTGSDGAITTTIPMATVGVDHRFAAQYLFVIASPSNHFTAITNAFVVTNAATGFTISGTITSNSTAVPYAAVLVGSQGVGQDHGFNPVTGTVADASGAYSVNVPIGLYTVIPMKANLLGVPASGVDPSSGTATANLSMVAANATISGQVVDSSNPSVPLPGLLLAAQGNGFSGVATDPNGNFTLSASTGSQWKIGGDQAAWDFLGYVSLNNDTKIDVSNNITGLQISYPKGNAMFYGRVVDTNNQPLAGVRLYGQNNNGSGNYQGDATTDANGNYSMAVIDGNWDVEVDIGSLSPELSGYVYSLSAFSYNGGNGTNISAGSAIRQDFVAIPAGNKISVKLLDSSSNYVAGVQINMTATINGATFAAQAVSPDSGFVTADVAAGTWNVSVNCCNNCGSGSLPPMYQCPNNQIVSVGPTNNAILTLIAPSYTSFISGQVRDDLGTPVTNVNIFAMPTNGGGGFFSGSTDNGGNYQIGLVGGSYQLQLNTDPTYGVPSLGLVSPIIPFTINDNQSISNFNVIARHVTGTIVATVTNGDNSQPVVGLNVYGNITANGTNYTTGSVPTGSTGAASMSVFNGNWSISLDCNALNSQNLNCPQSQNAGVANNTTVVNLVVHGATVPPPQFNQPSQPGPGQFQFHFINQPGHNYTLQYATALTNWNTFLITNPIGGDVIIIDSTATNRSRMYRALVGP